MYRRCLLCARKACTRVVLELLRDGIACPRVSLTGRVGWLPSRWWTVFREGSERVKVRFHSVGFSYAKCCALFGKFTVLTVWSTQVRPQLLSSLRFIEIPRLKCSSFWCCSCSAPIVNRVPASASSRLTSPSSSSSSRFSPPSRSLASTTSPSVSTCGALETVLWAGGLSVNDKRGGILLAMHVGVSSGSSLSFGEWQNQRTPLPSRSHHIIHSHPSKQTHITTKVNFSGLINQRHCACGLWNCYAMQKCKAYLIASNVKLKPTTGCRQALGVP